MRSKRFTTGLWACDITSLDPQTQMIAWWLNDEDEVSEEGGESDLWDCYVQITFHLLLKIETQIRSFIWIRAGLAFKGGF